MPDRYGMPDAKDIERERIRKEDAEAERIAADYDVDETRYRVTVWWPGMGEVRRRYYTKDVARAVRLKQQHGEATIYVWSGEKNGWQIATENSVK